MKTRHITFFAALALCVLALASSCTRKSSSATHPEWSYDAVVYEMNVRQFTPEGTFAAAQKELPRLKALGVDILWLMPIHPIGVEGRKGTLGSYYAVRDYKAVNPEFGTMEDFENFLSAAHKEGFHLVLDWVANHTAPDAVWTRDHRTDWYQVDSLGNFIIKYDWTDIAQLNYDNPEVLDAQVDAMKFWLLKGIDGFRCDVAGEMPVEVWEYIIPRLRSEYPDIYMLAEGEKTALHAAGFDATYAWELHHLLNDIAQGKKNIPELLEYVERDAKNYPSDAFRLMFTSNHDENSWSGTEFERMGDAADVMAVLCYTLPSSQPLIYTGQEVGWRRRFQFFEKDESPVWEANSHTALYQSLNSLKHTHPALLSGEKGGKFEVLSTADSTLVFTRTVPGDTVTVSAQLKAPWTYTISSTAH